MGSTFNGHGRPGLRVQSHSDRHKLPVISTGKSICSV